MYNLPDDFDENQLVGYYLGEVGIGPFNTNLRFSTPQKFAGISSIINICVKGTLGCYYGGDFRKCDAENPHSMTLLINFLMSDIDSVQRIGNASLKIIFKPGGYLVLDGDDSPNSEAYLIQIRGGDIVVV